MITPQLAHLAVPVTVLGVLAWNTIFAPDVDSLLRDPEDYFVQDARLTPMVFPGIRKYTPIPRTVPEKEIPSQVYRVPQREVQSVVVVEEKEKSPRNSRHHRGHYYRHRRR